MWSRLRMSFFYAVRSGRVPGIYRDWDTCKAQVNGFSGARYKKFKTAVEAQAFINEGTSRQNPTTVVQNSSRSTTNNPGSRPLRNRVVQDVDLYDEEPPAYDDEPPPSYDSLFSAARLPNPAVPLGGKGTKKRSGRGRPEPDNKRAKLDESSATESQSSASKKSVDVYTDGACERNGKANARAGIGVFWGPDHHMNVSERLPGRQTNNRAEIHAARKAIEQAKSLGIKHIRLFTDSQFLINAMTKWVQKWRKNGWKLINGNPVINREDFEQLLEAKRGVQVSWIHCRGHAGIYGNEMADKLAVDALSKPLPPH